MKESSTTEEYLFSFIHIVLAHFIALILLPSFSLNYFESLCSYKGAFPFVCTESPLLIYVPFTYYVLFVILFSFILSRLPGDHHIWLPLPCLTLTWCAIPSSYTIITLTIHSVHIFSSSVVHNFLCLGLTLDAFFPYITCILSLRCIIDLFWFLLERVNTQT